MKINIIKCLSDNYSYSIFDEKTNTVGVIDPSEFKPIDNFINQTYKKIDYILITHHHFDHVGGNIDLKAKYKCKVVGNKADANRIPAIDILLDDNSDFQLGKINFEIISLPGHTANHICYYSKEHKTVFTGDTLFSLGCGRVFEGTMEEMYNSLMKLKKLPSDTLMYCGHEYTQKNFEFCKTFDTENENLNKKAEFLKKLRTENLPSIPTSIGDEIKTNIFLRSDNEIIAKKLGFKKKDSFEVFKKLRDLKDNF